MSNPILRRISIAAAFAAVMAASPAISWSQDTPSDFIQRIDQNGDDLVSLDEFPGDPEKFRHLDTDGDGYLDAAETPNRPPYRQPDPRQILAEFDTDGDGQLSEDEFPGPEVHFDRLDTDGDGFLTQAELLAGRPGPPHGGGFERDDVDRDGKVSQAEFSGPKELFSRLDKDGDGYITQEEARAGHRPGDPRSMSEAGAGQE